MTYDFSVPFMRIENNTKNKKGDIAWNKKKDLLAFLNLWNIQD